MVTSFLFLFWIAATAQGGKPYMIHFYSSKESVFSDVSEPEVTAKKPVLVVTIASLDIFLNARDIWI
jgi:hypothetical protein